MPNCVAKPKGEKRSYIADEINQVKDISSLNLRRPVDRGYVVNWDLQRDILDHVFKKVLKINPKNCHLVITEAPFNLPALAAEQDECIFEKFGFKSALICPPSLLALTYHLAEAAAFGSVRVGAMRRRRRRWLLVRARHAGVRRQGLRNGIRRVNLGGKALTNYLKEMVSYRQWNMMDEYVLMDDVKEKLCCAAGSAADELKRAKVRGVSNEVNREYVLPDGVHVLRGYVKEGPARDPDAESSDDDDDDDDGGGKRRKKKRGGGEKRRKGAAGAGFVEQCLGMGNERFMVPEALFHPADIGLNQAGVAEVVTQAVGSVASDLRAMMHANVIVAGGCASFPGFKERFEAELRPLVPTEDALTVEMSDVADAGRVARRQRRRRRGRFRAAGGDARGVEEGRVGVQAALRGTRGGGQGSHVTGRTSPGRGRSCRDADRDFGSRIRQRVNERELL